MKKKFVSIITLIVISTLLITSCSKSAKTEEKTEEKVATISMEPFGSAIVYDPSIEINNGEKISIDFWEWGSEELFQQLVDDYTAVHPNVTINLVSNPWSDYWTKLPLMLKGKKGPALFNIHNSFHQNIINYCAPYNIPVEDLEKDFIGAKAHLIDGKIYYIDYGMMTGSVFYNKDMWAKAGLTDADIPTTWDEMIEVAKKLTIWEGDTLVQSGFNINGKMHQNYLLGVNYQLGQKLFNEDGTKIVLNNPAMKQIMQMLVDLYKVNKVGSKDFGLNSTDNFGQGQSAMIVEWGWFSNSLKSDFPDINYGVFEIPSFDNNPAAYNRYNGESTFGINKNADEKSQAVAQDVIKFFLASDKLQKQFNLEMNVFPAKVTLNEDKDILASPAGILSNHIDRYIWPGPMPATIEDTLKICTQEIMFNNADISSALQKAEDSINNDLESIDFQAVENLYKYADEL